MNRYMLREIVDILRESPFYETLAPEEKRTIIRGLAENYELLQLRCPRIDSQMRVRLERSNAA